jgi:hypothetical protein
MPTISTWPYYTDLKSHEHDHDLNHYYPDWLLGKEVFRNKKSTG